MTSIEWADTTWNPVTGCTEISRGCDHCYAKRLAERFHSKPPQNLPPVLQRLIYLLKRLLSEEPD